MAAQLSLARQAVPAFVRSPSRKDGRASVEKLQAPRAQELHKTTPGVLTVSLAAAAGEILQPPEGEVAARLSLVQQAIPAFLRSPPHGGMAGWQGGW